MSVIDTGFACGRHYLSVNGYVVAVEGDLCRDAVLPGMHWNDELFQLVLKQQREVAPIVDARLTSVPAADAAEQYHAEKRKQRDDHDKYCSENLLATAAAVEATSYEKHQLWRDWSLDYAQMEKLPTKKNRVHWEQLGRGFIEPIGEINGLPVNISGFWARLRVKPEDTGTLVLFWEICSRMADYDMAEEWLKENLPNAKNKTDAQNFHNVVPR